MKILIRLTLATLILFALIGCSKATPSANTPIAPQPPTVETPGSRSDSAPAPVVTPPVADPALVKAPAKPKTAPPAAPKIVTIQSFAFKPASLTINKGDTVKWVNKDGVMHTVNSELFKSEILQQNNFFSYTFTKAGSFPYHCSFHPSMIGTIIVKP